MSWTQGAKGVILTYHRIGTGGVPFYSECPTDLFEKQMQYVAENYRVVPLRTMCDELSNPQLRGQSIAVTFDDGYAELYREAFPILKKYSIPATVYLPSRLIESGEVGWYDKIFLTLQLAPEGAFEVRLNTQKKLLLTDSASRVQAATQIVRYLRSVPDPDRQRFCDELDRRVPVPAQALRNHLLSWPQICEMQEAGIHFGSHSATHPVISRLQREQIRVELLEPKQVLEERLGVPVVDFAFPFGKDSDCGAPIDDLLSECGYSSAVTTEHGANSSGANLFRLRRYSVEQNSGIPMFAARIAQLFLCSDDRHQPESVQQARVEPSEEVLHA